MLTSSLLLKRNKISWVNNSRIFRIKNAEFSMVLFLYGYEDVVKFLNLHQCFFNPIFSFKCKLFLLLNISDFSLFLCKNCNPCWKRSPLFLSNPPLEFLPSPHPFQKFDRRFNSLLSSPPPLAERWGAHYET